MADVDKVMAVLDVHRWKTMKGHSLTCECGVVLTLDDSALVPEDMSSEFYHSPLDEAFRRHIAEAVVAALRE